MPGGLALVAPGCWNTSCPHQREHPRRGEEGPLTPDCWWCGILVILFWSL